MQTLEHTSYRRVMHFSTETLLHVGIQACVSGVLNHTKKCHSEYDNVGCVPVVEQVAGTSCRLTPLLF